MAKRQLKTARRMGFFIWCYDFPHLPRFLMEVEHEEWLERKCAKGLVR